MTDEEIRRLLREARHDGPVPPEVVARLDDTLAGLVAERAEVAPMHPEAAPASVTSLDESRRRRRRASLVLAAAAVVVAGVGIGQVVRSGDEPHTTSLDATVADSGDRVTPDAAAPPVPANGAERDDLRHYAADAAPEPGLAALASATLEDDLLALRARPHESSPQLLREGRGCDIDRTGPGRWVPVTLDGRAGEAVFRPQAAGQQVVEVHLCGSDTAIRTVRLPAR
jgi:hypothetical protein